ncbi:helix-turn-helix domain-containing protein [Roseomonas terrae]|uniref:Helix-turn-helix domain-containing protein n=1 Tax=Neoroseomonas terrae TaxID=424799 RepID=A0ABS5EDK2_9PROT|nr:helix-turn-helix domain-containing protein [Neoroseomonas terrae]MBR0649097.1 helix-turn-helix domain-containing protein [Neoroseomonas terrae]
MATSGQILSQNGQSAAPRRDLPHDRVNRPLAAYARDYPEGEAVPRHSHDRAQLLYATDGIMRVTTDTERYTVPPARALWLPARLPHAVAMPRGLAMRALFLRADVTRDLPAHPAALSVSPLLRELILAACAEPLEWDERGRGGLLAALMLDEIRRAPRLPIAVPQPRDARLQRLAAALAADPASPLTLDGWATRSGASPRTLRRLFQAETGMGFARWRQALRLAEAAALLAAGATPARAASAVGYASAPAFGAAFRAAFGTTPGGKAAIMPG